MQHIELLALMATDGYQPAAEKLKDIYQYLLSLLINQKRLPKHRNFEERENVESLCMAVLTYWYDDMELLRLLKESFKPDSNNIDKLIEDSKSENELLSEMAFEVLCYVKDEKVHQYALELLKEESAGDYPLLMLLYIYRNTLCSCCRRSVVAEMGKRRMLTKEILEECSFDSNGDIREYAYRKLKK